MSVSVEEQVFVNKAYKCTSIILDNLMNHSSIIFNKIGCFLEPRRNSTSRVMNRGEMRTLILAEARFLRVAMECTVPNVESYCRVRVRTSGTQTQSLVPLRVITP